jgi:hypothetical protein
LVEIYLGIWGRGRTKFGTPAGIDAGRLWG